MMIIVVPITTLLFIVVSSKILRLVLSLYQLHNKIGQCWITIDIFFFPDYCRASCIIVVVDTMQRP